MPFVSVIIPTFHDWNRLQLCIDALKLQSYPADKFEVIIVNNDPDDIPSAIDLNENFILISEYKRGSYAARNAGIKSSKGDVLAFTDSDCIPDDEWLANSVEALSQEHPRIAGKIELFFTADKLTFGEAYEKAFAFRQDKYARKFNFGATANMMTYRSLFDAVGYFDETLFSGGDLEWGNRASCLGYGIIYSESSIVKHPARKSMAEIIRKKKRVVGGVFCTQNKKKNRLLIELFCGLMPPLIVGSEVFKRSDLSFIEKVKAVSLYYILKLLTIVEKIRLHLNLGTPKNT